MNKYLDGRRDADRDGCGTDARREGRVRGRLDRENDISSTSTCLIFSHTDLSDVFIGRPIGVRGGVGGAAANKYLESNVLYSHPPRSSTYLVFEVVIVDDGFDLRNCILSRANSFWTI